ncbi:hypothetical protein, partial [Vibrio cholerae]|nr:hypothetical protein [Vibrio cholerae]
MVAVVVFEFSGMRCQPLRRALGILEGALSDIILTILASVTASSVASAVIVWLSKTWITERVKSSIKHEYDLKLESYKAKVEIEKTAAIENIKSALKDSTFKRELRFSMLHGKRSEVISDLHAHLQDTIMFLRHYYDASCSHGDFDKLNESTLKLSNFLRVNRLFLPDDIEVKVDDLCDKILDSSQLEKDINFDVEDEIKPLFSAIKKEMKKLLDD